MQRIGNFFALPDWRLKRYFWFDDNRFSWGCSLARSEICTNGWDVSAFPG